MIAGIHERRRADVIGWIEQGIATNTVPKSVPAQLIADQFSASVIGIVYHWVSDPTKLDEIRSLHDGLKQVMQHLLSEEI